MELSDGNERRLGPLSQQGRQMGNMPEIIKDSTGHNERLRGGGKNSQEGII